MKPIICTLIMTGCALALSAQPQGGAAPADGNQVLFRQEQTTTSQAQTEKQLTAEINKLVKKLKLTESQKVEFTKLYTDTNEKLKQLDQRGGGMGMGGMMGGMMGARPQGAAPAQARPQAAQGAAAQGTAPTQGAAPAQAAQGAAPAQAKPQAAQGAAAPAGAKAQAPQGGAPAQARPQGAPSGGRMMMGRGMSPKAQIEEERNTAVKALLNEEQVKKYERYLRVKAANSGGGMGMGMGGM